MITNSNHDVNAPRPTCYHRRTLPPLRRPSARIGPRLTRARRRKARLVDLGVQALCRGDMAMVRTITRRLRQGGLTHA
jgi:hypothetical protein